MSATTIRAAQRAVTWVGLDVSKDTIAVGVLGRGTRSRSWTRSPTTRCRSGVSSVVWANRGG